ncbi:NAD(P)-dependent oxidoreductase [Roseovarius sp. MMSF_3281]|uniref:NAD(P)-dependent oxidoreductase n=1 Tax=Roseovarius sp. MMSF_3281 TaxID=3046694 RepID=UPI00273D538D|nr:NAD(P)-dependent oxidoreductase [Roseovarius sp. MMSF_3281]
MIGVVGCGAMGGAMIARLVEKGHDVHCFDAMPEARARAAAKGGKACATLAELAQKCDQIILSLPKAEVVTSVMADLAPHVQDGAIILDTSTSEPDTTKTLAAAAQGYTFIDGPVSGGPGGARAGTMTMVMGGPADAIAALRPVLDDLTAKTVHIGPAGAGHAAKIANNLLCAANLVLVSEMARLADSNGIPLANLLQGVNAGSGRSAVSEVNFPKWILNGAFDSGFTMGLMRKDVGLAIKLATQGGLDLPATRSVAAIWEASRDELPDSADFNEIFNFGTTEHA